MFADKTIKDLETETGKQLNEEERKIIEGFTAFMNMLWSNQENKKENNELNRPLMKLVHMN